jgi:hypothetical protein
MVRCSDTDAERDIQSLDYVVDVTIDAQKRDTSDQAVHHFRVSLPLLQCSKYSRQIDVLDQNLARTSHEVDKTPLLPSAREKVGLTAPSRLAASRICCGGLDPGVASPPGHLLLSFVDPTDLSGQPVILTLGWTAVVGGFPVSHELPLACLNDGRDHRHDYHLAYVCARSSHSR